MTLYYVNHVIHPIETPECYIYEQRDSICGVGVYHTFLVVRVTSSVRDPLVKDQFLLPIWNHLWFYKIKLYAKREEIT